tara:strand:- start:14520 stop:15131 length:612 start_codon:yes stop_codon:yes gene_type:complete
MAGLNKKIICFVDEYGTAGEEGFALGLVMVWANQCGKADKAFSDVLPASVNEVHAASWERASLQSLLAKYAQTQLPSGLLMINKTSSMTVGSRPIIYAKTLIESVKAAAKRFRTDQALGAQINNIEVIVDLNNQNTHATFCATVDKAIAEDGLFRAVTRVVAIDSTVARMLQLADVVAHSRSWIVNGAENAKGLRESYKIEVL